MEHNKKAANYCLTDLNCRAAANRLTTKKSDLSEQFVLLNQRRMTFRNILLDGGEIKHRKQPRQYEHAPVIASKLFILVQNFFLSIIFQKLANYTIMWYIFDAINTVPKSLFPCSIIHHVVKELFTYCNTGNSIGLYKVNLADKLKMSKTRMQDKA